jgi:hypothetical protein
MQVRDLQLDRFFFAVITNQSAEATTDRANVALPSSDFSAFNIDRPGWTVGAIGVVVYRLRAFARDRRPSPGLAGVLFLRFDHLRYRWKTRPRQILQ